MNEDTPGASAPPSLGPWLPQTVLGRGGMAVVYGVVHEDDATCQRAVKVLLDGSRDVRRRLRREGLVQGAMGHKNVVHVHEVIDLNGAPALVMDLVQGPTLSALCGGARVPLSIVDDIVRDVLLGVQAAHRGGVVHRDLKPGNVLLQPTSGRWTARVSDFGLAHVDRPLDSLRTAAGVVAGTLAYMAPEQLRDARRATPRSDVFALGALIFELLVGRRCFSADDNVALIEQITTGALPDVHDLRDGVPTDWVHAVRAALERDPSRRPADARELLSLWTTRLGGADWSHAVDRRVSGAFSPEVVVSSGGWTRSHNLPIYDDHFVRPAESMRAVERTLMASQLVTMVGAGGVGKTRLSVEIGQAALDEYSGGVWFCDLTEARSVAGVARAVAQALDVPLTANPVDGLGDALLGRGRCLVVLDNFEQVVEHGASTVGVWMERAPSAKFLVTSRRPLELQAERVVPIDVLATPDMNPSEGPTGAVALFVARAREASGAFTVQPDEWPVIHEIVKALDGLPLAVELVAARARTGRLERLRKVLQGRLYSLSSGRSDAPHRRTLRATLQWSWDLLSPHERQVLGQVCVVQGGFSESAALEVVLAPDLLSSLMHLVDRSLVRVRGAGADRRYSLLVSVRAMVMETWGPVEDERGLDAARRRHAGFFGAQGEPEQVRAMHCLGAQAWRRCAADLDNVVSAARFAMDAGHAALGARAALLGAALLSVLGPVDLGVELCEQALAASAVDSNVRGLIRLYYVDFLLDTAKTDRAIDEAQRLSDWAVQTERWLLAAESLAALVYSSEQGGRVAQADELSQRAVRVAERCDDRRVLAICLWRRADVLYRVGQPDAAQGVYVRARDVAEAIGDRRLEGKICRGLGRVLLMAGRYGLAEPEYLRALQRANQWNDRGEEAICRAHMGNLYRDQGRWDEAWIHYERALHTSRLLGLRAQEASIISNMGHQCMSNGQLVEAERWLSLALSMHREQNNRQWQAYVLSSLGNVEQHRGDLRKAGSFHTAALQLYQDLDLPYSQSGAHVNLGELAIKLGDLDSAAAHLSAARELALRSDNRPTLLVIESELSLLGVVSGGARVVQSHVHAMRDVASDHGSDSHVVEATLQSALALLLVFDDVQALQLGEDGLRLARAQQPVVADMVARSHAIVAVVMARKRAVSDAWEHRALAEVAEDVIEDHYYRHHHWCLLAEVDVRIGDIERGQALLRRVQEYVQEHALRPRSSLANHLSVVRRIAG